MKITKLSEKAILREQISLVTGCIQKSTKLDWAFEFLVTIAVVLMEILLLLHTVTYSRLQRLYSLR